MNQHIVKNIVFDLGKVLLEFEPLEFLENNFSHSDQIERLYDEIFMSKEWLDLDRGIISYEQAIHSISGRIPEEYENVKFCIENWWEILVPIEKNIDFLLKNYKEGKCLYLISNFHKTAFEKVYKKYDFFRYFHNMMLSYKVHLLKPEKEIFQLMCDEFSILPQESLFIDDTRENIETAKTLGFKTIHFQGQLLD